MSINNNYYCNDCLEFSTIVVATIFDTVSSPNVIFMVIFKNSHAYTSYHTDKLGCSTQP